jgi:UDP-3-O-[3-hydroxymyristoyl] N-acetylglucosamine deacetylase
VDAPIAQRTITRVAMFGGAGIHSGVGAEVACRAAPPGTGIVFVREDLPGRPQIPARIDQVADTRRSVTLGRLPAVRTVEHLLAAAAGLGITNLLVGIRGAEMPIIDGSAAPYVEAFRAAGLADQPAAVDTVVLDTPVWAVQDAGWVLAVPAARFRVTYIVPTGHPVLGTQVAEFDPAHDDFATSIAPARTWGFAGELDALRAAGFAQGATPGNTLGIGPGGYLTPPRFSDEPARHKILDLIGDLTLLGRRVRAHVVACAAGHGLHVALARKMVETVKR